MDNEDMKSYISSKVEMRKSPLGGEGLFVNNKIDKGEIVVDYTSGPGTFVDADKADELYEKGNDYIIQVDENRFFVAREKHELEEADFLNHSCDPNCGIRGNLQIVAIRDIEPGEEVTFDYAMTESSDYSMDCKCGSKNCRKIITGEDWRDRELQRRYEGYFSEYLQRNIDNMPVR